MSALTADRSTARRDGTTNTGPVAASVTCYAGAIAVLDAAGNLRPGYTATTLIAAGVFQEQVINGAVAGAVNATVRMGVFRFNNSSAGDLIARTEIGKVVYIVDDQTVAKTNGTSTRSAAGTVVDVDTDGVWVRIGF